VDEEEEEEELVDYRQKLKMLKELKEIIKHPYDLTENYHLFNEFITFDGKWIQPKHKWGGRKPKICVFVDDAQSTRIFRNRHFLILCTRSRHIGSFEGDEASIGVSLFIACQNYTATGGGLPRAVRGNATHMALWRTKNKDELNIIAKEMAGEVSPEKFIEVYDYIMMTRRTDMFSCSSTSTKKTAIQVCSAKTTPTSLLCKAVLIRQSSVI